MNKYKLLLAIHWPFIIFVLSLWLNIIPIDPNTKTQMFRWVSWYYVMMFPILSWVWFNCKERE